MDSAVSNEVASRVQLKHLNEDEELLLLAAVALSRSLRGAEENRSGSSIMSDGDPVADRASVESLIDSADAAFSTLVQARRAGLSSVEGVDFSNGQSVVVHFLRAVLANDYSVAAGTLDDVPVAGTVDSSEVSSRLRAFASIAVPCSRWLVDVARSLVTAEAVSSEFLSVWSLVVRVVVGACSLEIHGDTTSDISDALQAIVTFCLHSSLALSISLISALQRSSVGPENLTAMSANIDALRLACSVDRESDVRLALVHAADQLRVQLTKASDDTRSSILFPAPLSTRIQNESSALDVGDRIGLSGTKGLLSTGHSRERVLHECASSCTKQFSSANGQAVILRCLRVNLWPISCFPDSLPTLNRSRAESPRSSDGRAFGEAAITTVIQSLLSAGGVVKMSAVVMSEIFLSIDAMSIHLAWSAKGNEGAFGVSPVWIAALVDSLTFHSGGASVESVASVNACLLVSVRLLSMLHTAVTCDMLVSATQFMNSSDSSGLASMRESSTGLSMDADVTRSDCFELAFDLLHRLIQNLDKSSAFPVRASSDYIAVLSSSHLLHLTTQLSAQDMVTLLLSFGHVKDAIRSALFQHALDAAETVAAGESSEPNRTRSSLQGGARYRGPPSPPPPPSMSNSSNTVQISRSRSLAASEELMFRVGEMFDETSGLADSQREVSLGDSMRLSLKGSKSIPQPGFACAARAAATLVHDLVRAPQLLRQLLSIPTNDDLPDSQLLSFAVLAAGEAWARCGRKSVLDTSWQLILDLLQVASPAPSAMLPGALTLLRINEHPRRSLSAPLIAFFTRLILMTQRGLENSDTKVDSSDAESLMTFWKTVLSQFDSAAAGVLDLGMIQLLLVVFHSLHCTSSKIEATTWLCSVFSQAIETLSVITEASKLVQHAANCRLLLELLAHIAVNFETPPSSWLASTAAALAASEKEGSSDSYIHCVSEFRQVIKPLSASDSAAENVAHMLWFEDHAAFSVLSCPAARTLPIFSNLRDSLLSALGNLSGDHRLHDTPIDDADSCVPEAFSFLQSVLFEFLFLQTCLRYTSFGLPTASESRLSPSVEVKNRPIALLVCEGAAIKAADDVPLRDKYERASALLVEIASQVDNGLRVASRSSAIVHYAASSLCDCLSALTGRDTLSFGELQPLVRLIVSLTVTWRSALRQRLVTYVSETFDVSLDLAKSAVDCISIGTPVSVVLATPEATSVVRSILEATQLSAGSSAAILFLHADIRALPWNVVLSSGRDVAYQILRRTLLGGAAVISVLSQLLVLITRSATQESLSSAELEPLLPTIADQLFLCSHENFGVVLRIGMQVESEAAELFGWRVDRMIDILLRPHDASDRWNAVFDQASNMLAPSNHYAPMRLLIEQRCAAKLDDMISSIICNGGGIRSEVLLELLIASLRESTEQLRPLVSAFCAFANKAVASNGPDRAKLGSYLKTILFTQSDLDATANLRPLAFIESIFVANISDLAMTAAVSILTVLVDDILSLDALRHGGRSLETLGKVLFDLATRVSVPSKSGLRSEDIAVRLVDRITALLREVVKVDSEDDMLHICDGVRLLLERLLGSFTSDGSAAASGHEGNLIDSLVLGDMIEHPNSRNDFACARKPLMDTTNYIRAAFEHITQAASSPDRQYLLLHQYAEYAGSDSLTEPQELAQSADMARMHRCTFAKTGREYALQHWYFCYTCGMTQNDGCCSVCALSCHKGHELAYSRRSRFFCDCGANAGPTPCISLDHDVLSDELDSKEAAEMTSTQAQDQSLVVSLSSPGLYSSSPSNTSSAVSIAFHSDHLRLALTNALSSLTEYLALALGNIARRSLASNKPSTPLQVSDMQPLSLEQIRCFAAPVEFRSTALVEHRGSFQPQAFDCKLKSPRFAELRAAISAQRQSPHFLTTIPSMLTTSTRPIAVVVVAEGDTVRLVDVSAILESAHGDRAIAQRIARRSHITESLGFPVVGVRANESCDSHIVAWGTRHVQILRLQARDSERSSDNLDTSSLLARVTASSGQGSKSSSFPLVVSEQLSVELGLVDKSSRVLFCEWLPQSPVALAVVTEAGVKIFDLSDDLISPSHHFVVLEGDSIKSACFGIFEGLTRLLVGTQHGHILSHVVSFDRRLALQGTVPDSALPGAGTVYLTDAYDVAPTVRASGDIVGLYYSARQNLVFVASASGSSFAARLEADGGSIAAAFTLKQAAPGDSAVARASADSLRCSGRWFELSPSFECEDNNEEETTVSGTELLAPIIGYVSHKSNTFVLYRLEMRSYGHAESCAVSSQVLDFGGRSTARVLGLSVLPTPRDVTSFGALPCILTLLEDGSMWREVPRVSAKTSATLADLSVHTAHDQAKRKLSPIQFVNATHEAVATRRKNCGLSASLSPEEECELRRAAPTLAFEYLLPIGARVAFAGSDVLEHGSTPENVLTNLQPQNEGHFVQSPRTDGFDIEVVNGGASKVALAGVRILLGAAASNCISRRVSLLGRVVAEPEAGQRHWYDIPFTQDEILIGHRSVTLHFSECHDATQHPAVDSIVPYGVAKDVFGFDMHLRTLGIATSGKEENPIFVSRAVAALKGAMKAGAPGAGVARALSSCSDLLGALCTIERDVDVLTTARAALVAVFAQVGSEVRHAGKAAAVLNRSLKYALQSVCPRKRDQIKLKDDIARRTLSSLLEECASNEDALLSVASCLRSMVRKRQRVLVDVLLQPTSADKVVLLQLCDTFARVSLPANQRASVAGAVVEAAIICAAHGVSVGIEQHVTAAIMCLTTMFGRDQRTTTISSHSSIAAINFFAWLFRMRRLAELPSHVEYRCDGCGCGPLLGDRWSCVDCALPACYDLCEACYANRASRYTDETPEQPVEVGDAEMQSNSGHTVLHTFKHVSYPAGDEVVLTARSALPLSLNGLLSTDEATLHDLAAKVSMLPVTEPVPTPFVPEFHAPTTAASLAAGLVTRLFRQDDAVHCLRGNDLLAAGQVVSQMLVCSLQAEFLPPTAVAAFKEATAILDASLLQLAVDARWYEQQSSLLETMITMVLLTTSVLEHARTLVRQNGHGDKSDDSDAVGACDTESEADKMTNDVVMVDSSDRLTGFYITLSGSDSFPKLIDALPNILMTAGEHEETEFANATSVANVGQMQQRRLLSKLARPAALSVTASAASARVSTPSTDRNWSPLLPNGYARMHPDLFLPFRHLLALSLLRLLRVTFACSDAVLTADEILGLSNRPVLVSESDSTSLPSLAKRVVAGLCSFLNAGPSQSRLRIEAKRTLRAAVGSAIGYRQARDFSSYEQYFSILRRIDARTEGFRRRIDFDSRVEVVEQIAAVAGLARANPRVWQTFALRGDSHARSAKVRRERTAEVTVGVLPLVMRLAFSADDVATERVLCLLDWALLPSESKGSSDLVQASSAAMALMQRHASLFGRLVERLLLHARADDVRMRAANVVAALWRAVAHPSTSHSGLTSHSYLRDHMLQMLLGHLESAASHGLRAKNYLQVVALLLRDHSDHLFSTDKSSARAALAPLARRLTTVVNVSLRILRNHPNAPLYDVLGRYMHLDGFYLENAPCFVCSDPPLPWQFHTPLESVQAESKFTGNSRLVRFAEPLLLRGFRVKVSERRAGRSVHALNVYVSTRPVSDITMLRGKWEAWQRIKAVDLRPDQNSLVVEFSIPAPATCILFEYASFHEDIQALSEERIQCPRCSTVITTSVPTCPNCKENVHQCRKCRNINFDDQNSFLCNECGHSKWANFHYFLDARPHVGCLDNVTSDAQRDAAAADLQRFSVAADEKWDSLARHKDQIAALVHSLHDDTPEDLESALFGMDADSRHAITSNDILPVVARLTNMYGSRAKAAFDDMSRSVQQLLATRRELQRYIQVQRLSGQPLRLNTSLSRVATPSTDSATVNNEHHCFGCTSDFLAELLGTTLTHLCTPLKSKIASGSLDIETDSAIAWCEMLSEGGVTENLTSSLRTGSVEARQSARRALSVLAGSSDSAADLVHRTVVEQVANALQHHRLGTDVTSAVSVPLLELWAETTVATVRDISGISWEKRARELVLLFFSAVPRFALIPSVADAVVVPLLTALSELTDVTTLIVESTSEDFSTGSPSLAFRAPGSSTVDSARWLHGDTGFDPWRMVHASEFLKLDQDSANANDVKLSLARKYWLRWRQFSKPSPTSRRSSASFLAVLLFHPTSSTLRAAAVRLFESWSLSGGSSHRFTLVAIAAEKLLPFAGEAQHSSREFFEWFSSQLLVTERVGSELEESSTQERTLPVVKFFLSARGFLRVLCILVAREVDRVRATEHAVAVDLSRGFVLSRLVLLLSSMLSADAVLKRAKRDVLRSETGANASSSRADNMLDSLLAAFLALRGVVLQRTKYVDEAQCSLGEVLDSLTGGAVTGGSAPAEEEGDGDLETSAANTKVLIAAYVRALDKCADDRTPIFVFEQLHDVVSPHKTVPQYFVQVNKDPMIEEFISGFMTQNPYALSTIVEEGSDGAEGQDTSQGPTMGQVKDRILQTLRLDPELGIELLVADHIVSHALPVRAVFEHLWKPSLAAEQREAITQAASLPAACKPPVNSDQRMNHPLAPYAMPITFRIQGFGGEATEEMFERVPESGADDRDPEEQYAVTNVLRDCGALEKLVQVLQSVGDFAEQRELSRLVVRLLYFCSRVRANRRHLVETTGALPVLLSKLSMALDAAESAEASLHANTGDMSSPDTTEPGGKGAIERARATVNIAEMLLSTIEAIVQEINRDMPFSLAPAVNMSGSTLLTASTGSDLRRSQSIEGLMTMTPMDERRQQLSALLRRLEESELLRSNAHLRQALARVLPFLTYGDAGIAGTLIDFFAPYLDLPSFDLAEERQEVSDGKQRIFLRCWTDAVQSLSVDDGVMKDQIVAKGLIAELAAYLKAFDPKQESHLIRPGLSHALEQIAYISSRHLATQRALLDAGVIPLLHELEKVTSVESVGNLAENALEAMCEMEPAKDDLSVISAVRSIRSAEAASKKEKARLHREQMLRQMGLAVPGKVSHQTENAASSDSPIPLATPAASDSLLAMMAEMDDEEESGVVCVTCREGFKLQPEEVMGVYVFGVVRPLNTLSLKDEEDPDVQRGRRRLYAADTEGITSVTYFNPIHFSCHSNAARAEQQMRPSKEEWEGAAIRNQHAKCNNLLPLLGPETPDSMYAEAVQQYWTRYDGLLGHGVFGQASRLQSANQKYRTLVHDMKFLLIRFARQESFCALSGMGGRDSNARLLPPVIVMGLHMLTTSSQWTTAEASLEQYLHMSATEEMASAVAQRTDTAYYHVASALLLQSIVEWDRTRFEFLRKLLVCEYQYSLDASLPSSSPSTHSLTRRVRPALVYFGIVDRLQRLFKSNLSDSADHGSSAPNWAAALVAKMRADPVQTLEIVGGEWLESYKNELLPLEDAQEFFDDFGLLDKVLDQSSSADDFISDLIGKA